MYLDHLLISFSTVGTASLNNLRINQRCVEIKLESLKWTDWYYMGMIVGKGYYRKVNSKFITN